jgi:hypothetical protein
MIFRANSLPPALSGRAIWNFGQAFQQWIDAWLKQGAFMDAESVALDIPAYVPRLDTCPFITCRDGARLYDVSSLDKVA